MILGLTSISLFSVLGNLAASEQFEAILVWNRIPYDRFGLKHYSLIQRQEEAVLFA